MKDYDKIEGVESKYCRVRYPYWSSFNNLSFECDVPVLMLRIWAIIVADPNLLFSDPDPDPTWRVITDPDPTWRVIRVISDPDPNGQVISVSDPDSELLCSKLRLHHCIFHLRGLMLNDNYRSGSGSYWSGNCGSGSGSC